MLPALDDTIPVLRWHVLSWKVPVMLPVLSSKEGLGAWAQTCQAAGLCTWPCWRGGSRQELGRNQPLSHPPRQGRAQGLRQEGSEQQNQDVVQCKALDQGASEVEHLALVCLMVN